MNLPRVPEILIGGVAELPELFFASARWRGLGRQDVEAIVRLVPHQIRALPCFLDRLTGLWRYDYGDPFVDLPGGGAVFGTNMYQEVDRLFDVIQCARKRLPERKLNNYLTRLFDAQKHQDMLAEFVPILRLDSSIQADYEVEGYGEGNRTIDWLIRCGEISLLLDVKNRTRDLIESLVALQAHEGGPNDSVPEPMHSPSLLFRSVESKFTVRSTVELLQGAWIVTGLKQEETELTAAFASLDSSRVHAAILGDWDKDVYVLAKDSAVKDKILRLLNLEESRRFVFKRGDNLTP